jgi:hypothetical protein
MHMESFSPDFRARVVECLTGAGVLDHQARLVVAVIYRLIYSAGERDGLARTNV